MHVTISCGQLNTYGDLLERLLPAAIKVNIVSISETEVRSLSQFIFQTAMEEDVEFRRGLPRDFMSFTGEARRGDRGERRERFLAEVKRLAEKAFEYASVDRGEMGCKLVIFLLIFDLFFSPACDDLGKRFLHDCLPPYLTPREEARSVGGNGEKWHAGKNKVKHLTHYLKSYF